MPIAFNCPECSKGYKDSAFGPRWCARCDAELPIPIKAKAAKVHGTKSGRPIGRPRRVFDKEAVVRFRAEGLSWSRIARQLGLGWEPLSGPIAVERTQWQVANPNPGLLNSVRTETG